jgi:hypothetical protein
MSEFVPNESSEIVIAVCGEQSSGKTVFLTCIFQSVWTAFKNDVVIDFDRKEIGNASYFQAIEDALIARGPAPGTTDRALFPARIYVKPYESLPGPPRSKLSVDILDFAGRHFRSIADLKHLLDESGGDADETKALREVNDTLERADAFVILINSREIDPINLSPKRNPFGPSVNFILSHCRSERKPLALLFSQIDQTPLLTEDVLRSIPRVQRFKADFTDDLREASSSNGRPFGIVRRISCYETLEDDLTPRSQDAGGNIWRPEPAEIILDLIRATMPAIKQRLADAATAQQRVRDDAALAQLRKTRRQWAFAAAALLVALIVAVIVAVQMYQRSERRQVSFVEGITARVREGNLVSISPAVDTALNETLGMARAGTGDSHAAVRSAVRDLESAFGETGQRFAASPLLDAGYGANIARFVALTPHFDSGVSAEWRQKLVPLFTARNEVLVEWFGNARQGHERTRYLDATAKRFSIAGDRAFSDLLSRQSTREKENEIAAWQARIDADPDVGPRLVTIQNLLAIALQDEDPEFTLLARKALAGHVMRTLLKRSENGILRDQLLTPLVPDLARFRDGDVRFDVLARDLLNCSTKEECENRKSIVEAVVNAATSSTESSGSAVENLLRSLLLDLPREERREVWNSIAVALAESYFFSSRGDAWPDGVAPLHINVAAWASTDRDSTVEVIERLAQRPIYAEELDYLKDRLAATEVRRKVVPIYSAILYALTQRSGVLPSEALVQVGQEVSSSLAGRDSKSPLGEIAGEINQVLDLVRSVNSVRARGLSDDSVSSARLQRLLRDFYRGHCAALAAHEAPAECANAA